MIVDTRFLKGNQTKASIYHVLCKARDLFTLDIIGVLSHRCNPVLFSHTLTIRTILSCPITEPMTINE